MTDDLRTRIAAMLKAHPDLISGKCHGIEEPELQFDHQDQWADHVADVVIEELGLRQQVAGPDGIAYGKHRFVTDWIANE